MILDRLFPLFSKAHYHLINSSISFLYVCLFFSHFHLAGYSRHSELSPTILFSYYGVWFVVGGILSIVNCRTEWAVHS